MFLILVSLPGDYLSIMWLLIFKMWGYSENITVINGPKPPRKRGYWYRNLIYLDQLHKSSTGWKIHFIILQENIAQYFTMIQQGNAPWLLTTNCELILNCVTSHQRHLCPNTTMSNQHSVNTPSNYKLLSQNIPFFLIPNETFSGGVLWDSLSFLLVE